MRGIVKCFGSLLAPIARQFYRALENPQQAQSAVQQQLVQRLQRCEYGRQFQVRNLEDWHRLPIVSYEDLQPYIEDLPNSQIPLTPEPVLFYEPTSGSSGPIKRIPYTRSLRRSFNHLFCVWAHDLITHGPCFSSGKLYFSISPTFSDSNSATGTTDDSDYLDPWLRWLLKPFLVISPPTTTPADFKKALARTLLKAENLEIISIWSPSFLTAQLDYIQSHKEQLYGELKDDMSVKRSHLLLQTQIPWTDLWPRLKLISCWDSAMAADGADGLRQLFPNVLVQGKGLLATEAPMTVPLIAAKGQVPLLDRVYFEFEDNRGRCHKLHELEIGKTYEVIISQMGGLYRYRMGDRVRVTHYFLKTPCLEFVGRGQSVSDLVGEKLNAQFVCDRLKKLDLSTAQFQSLIPVLQPQPHYVLLLDRVNGDIGAIAQALENALCESFHYRLARQLDQLTSVQVIVSSNVAEQLSAYRAQSGQRWGEVKHARLGSAVQSLSFLVGRLATASKLSPTFMATRMINDPLVNNIL